MKFNLILSLVLVLSFSYQCNSNHKQAAEPIQIDGQLSRPEITNLFLLTSSGDTLKSIDVTPDNTFAIELQPAKEGYYSLHAGKEEVYLYLSPGDKL